MDEDDEQTNDHDWIGPGLAPLPAGQAPFGKNAPLWTEKKDPKKKEPPRVKYVQQSESGDRYVLSSGSHVLHSNLTNKWTCLFSQCINAGKANECRHISIAQQYAVDHVVNPEIIVGSDPDASPFRDP